MIDKDLSEIADPGTLLCTEVSQHSVDLMDLKQQDSHDMNGTSSTFSLNQWEASFHLAFDDFPFFSSNHPVAGDNMAAGSLNHQLSSNLDTGWDYPVAYESGADMTLSSSGAFSVFNNEPNASYQTIENYHFMPIADPSPPLTFNDIFTQNLQPQPDFTLQDTIGDFDSMSTIMQDDPSIHGIAKSATGPGNSPELSLQDTSFAAASLPIEYPKQQDLTLPSTPTAYVTPYFNTKPSNQLISLPQAKQVRILRPKLAVKPPTSSSSLVLRRKSIKHDKSNDCANQYVNGNSIRQRKPSTSRLGQPHRVKKYKKVPSGVPSNQFNVWAVGSQGVLPIPSWKRNNNPCFLCMIDKKRVSIPAVIFIGVSEYVY
jgi:hypothetical protein